MTLDMYTQKKYFNKVKVGDKLFIKDLTKIYNDFLNPGIRYDKSFPGVNYDMLSFSESFVTVINKEASDRNYIYYIKEDNGCWSWTLHFIDISKTFKENRVLPIE